MEEDVLLANCILLCLVCGQCMFINILMYQLRGSNIEQIFEVVFAHGETIVQRMNICHRISRTIFITYGHFTTDTFL